MDGTTNRLDIAKAAQDSFFKLLAEQHASLVPYADQSIDTYHVFIYACYEAYLARHDHSILVIGDSLGPDN